MSSEVRPIPEGDVEAFVRIAANAYPAFEVSSDEQVQRLAQRMWEAERRDGGVTRLYGLYREGRLVGGMRLFDFTMNMFGAMVPVGGVGMVAVDLAHKRRHVAKELIAFYLRHYRERGAPLAALYPFRPDFYRQMGFGLGPKMDQYRLKPTALPAQGDRGAVRFLTADDREALAGCYARYATQTHGMMLKRDAEVDALFDNPEHRLVGFVEGGELRGYLSFQFQRGKTFLLNDIEVRELVYETRPALLGLLAFLRSQADQIQTVVVNTQDEHFHHLLLDPRNDTDNLLPSVYHESNVSGVGLMYRAIDTPALFRALQTHDFNGQTCGLRLIVHDDFLPENDGALTLHVEGGRLRAISDEAGEVEVRIGVAALSSMVMGVVPLERLVLYGLAEISDPAQLGTASRLFLAAAQPQCVTRF